MPRRSSSLNGPTTERHARTIRAKLIVDADHYVELVTRAISGAAVSVWIGTANLKTMLVEAPIGTRARARGRYVSFFESLRELSRRGVDVRILHSAPPSRPLAAELERHAHHPLALRRCPRVHLKMIAVDGRLLYLGSANLTGAGLGAKGDGRRNFEMGMVTDDESMLDTTQERFDRIWSGKECAACKLRHHCDAPLDRPRAKPSRHVSRTSRMVRADDGPTDDGPTSEALRATASVVRKLRSQRSVPPEPSHG